MFIATTTKKSCEFVSERGTGHDLRENVVLVVESILLTCNHRLIFNIVDLIDM